MRPICICASILLLLARFCDLRKYFRLCFFRRRDEKYIASPVAFVDKISDALATDLRKIAHYRNSSAVVYKLLRNLTRDARRKIKKFRRDISLVQNQIVFVVSIDETQNIRAIRNQYLMRINFSNRGIQHNE